MTSNAKKWQKIRKLGRKQFVLRYGVLGWGLPVAILFSASMGYQHGWDTFLPHLIPALFLFPLGGIFFGSFLWWWLERQNASTIASE